MAFLRASGRRPPACAPTASLSIRIQKNSLPTIVTRATTAHRRCHTLPLLPSSGTSVLGSSRCRGIIVDVGALVVEGHHWGISSCTLAWLQPLGRDGDALAG